MNKIYFDHSFTIPHIYDTNILILKNNFTFQKMAFSFKEKCIHSLRKETLFLSVSLKITFQMTNLGLSI